MIVASSRPACIAARRFRLWLAITASALAPTAALAAAPATAQPAADDPAAAPRVLGSVTVRGKAEPVFATEAPDADRSAVGKPRVLTTTTTHEQYERLQVDSLADYTRRIDAGLSVSGSDKSIAMRGLGADRVLVTIDGVRTPWLDDGARGVKGGVTSFDFDGLAGIDVIRSADSSFYGTGAMAGVVALRTFDPEDILRDGKTYGGLSRASYDSASDSVYLNQALAARRGDTLLLVEGGWRAGGQTDNKGTVGGSGTTRNQTNPASYDQDSVSVKLRQYLAGGHRLTLAGEWFDRSYNENTLTSLGSTYSAYRTLTKTGRRRVSAAWDYAGSPGGLVEEAHALGYWQRGTLETLTESTRLVAPVGAYDRDSVLRQDMFGGRASATLRLATGAVVHHVTINGEAYATRAHQYAAGQDNCTSAIRACAYLHVNQSDMPDVHGTDLGLVVQDRMELGPVRLTPGLRYDWYDRDPRDSAAYRANAAYAGLPAGSRGGKWSPKLLGEVDVAPHVTLYGQWAQAFRAPSATELYLAYGGNGSYVSVGNPALRPETSRGWEAGVKAGDAALGAKASFYDTRYRNFIDTITTTAAAAGLSGSFPLGVFQYVNRQAVRIHGAEAEVHATLAQHWKLWGSLAYANGKDTAQNVHLNSVAPLKGVVGAGYVGQAFGADATLTAAAKRTQVETPASDTNKTPAYQVVDLSAWWRPAVVPGLKLGAAVNNLFDVTWYNALDIPDSQALAKAYYTQPGRTFKLTAQLEF